MRVPVFMAMLIVAASASHATPADARLRTLYTAEWTWRVAQFADDEDNTRPVPSRLPHVDPASQAARLATWQNVLAKVNAIMPAQLSPKEQVNAQVYRFNLESLIAGQKFRDYEMPANSDSSFWSDFSDRARRPFRNLADYRAWIAQMRDIPRYFRETSPICAPAKSAASPRRASPCWAATAPSRP
jgi:uncharacterized protein (DUF885 family)